ncbi:hypothetical protein OPT61_g5100 [Boeremia exigua]|uniref:Uncharacterized protein n=1 Tax=Boeremia exigua TaxID=749465 RepID=A0ACC2IBM6_9PLEO|nr:hypothetical protein OPT61_g5100 [Boeremia exigua]
MEGEQRSTSLYRPYQIRTRVDQRDRFMSKASGLVSPRDSASVKQELADAVPSSSAALSPTGNSIPPRRKAVRPAATATPLHSRCSPEATSR